VNKYSVIVLWLGLFMILLTVYKAWKPVIKPVIFTGASRVTTTSIMTTSPTTGGTTQNVQAM
jgi:hypothetical protein